MRKLLLLSVCTCLLLLVSAQRTYRANSVLASGNWFKISVAAEGIYKMDAAFLNSLGIAGNVPSSQIRIFGNGGGMLHEANGITPIDDLQEIAIWVEDGGDGSLSGQDYILFYAQGPDHWLKDSVNKRFLHQKNLYSDRAFYYLTIGGTGLRIPTQNGSFPATASVSSFDERYFHELDTVNFLSSGKEWFGEELSGFPGRSLTRSFQLPLTDLLPQQATIVTNVAARSVNSLSRFNVAVNNQQVQQLSVPPIGTGTYDLFAQQAQQADNFILNSANVTVSITYSQGSFNSQGWLNWFEFFGRRNLTMPQSKQLLFRDWSSVGSGNVEFVISNAEILSQVWDVTDPLHPVKMNATLSVSQLRFSNDAQRLREYVCFSTDFLTPIAEGRVNNQNLHSTTEKDFLIVTAPEFLQEAQRLAQFHQQKNNLRTVVVTTDQVFNEFSGGNPDPTAVRDFVKMYYDRYRSTWNNSGKYLLLFGKASFDYKNRITNNTNRVPSYESVNSLDPLSTYTSDDFFGFLDDNEDINSSVIINQLDIGIGRIPAKTPDEARNFVDKVLDYHSPEAFGPWRNNLNFIADDEDNNLHLQDAETLTATVSSTAPLFNQQKIYLDAFHQESGSAGGTYPQANTVINSNIYNGTLLWNYSGHGGS
ncbi:MAG TPA: type IX secretion system sortase PorU, partial [Flavisolibacter sp.]|nr:type IX secretion system sortase PorU [Flavisolibacter sp.]